MFETESKPIPITREMVKKAYLKVKGNAGTYGVDKESLSSFESNLSDNLYKLWNRMSSGSYFPKAVRSVSIPKSNGKKRILGIPTVTDRIAQEVVKSYLEPRLEKEFHKNSYGYRPLKSAHQALEAVAENIREYAWVIDMDIKSFFDEVDHELLMKSLQCHVEERWVLMYVKRWLESPIQGEDGKLEAKSGIGTPQGGVISPLLANLFLHYVLDKWLTRHYSEVAFVRYADDLIIHCKSENEAKEVHNAIRERLEECKLRLNEDKTKVVYCQDYRRLKKTSFGKKFDFLGFTFKPRAVRSKKGGVFLGYGCGISQSSQSRIVKGWKEQKWHRQSQLTLQEIANQVNPQMRGIINYYGKLRLKALQVLMRHFEFRLSKWVLNKYKSLGGNYRKAYQWIKTMKKSYPDMFYYWQIFKHV